MNTLEQQIEKLKIKATFEAYAEGISFGVKHTACMMNKYNFISFAPSTLDEAKKLLIELKPTNKTNVIGTATDKFFKKIDSPYKLSIDNPIQPNQWNPFSLNIKFWFDVTEIWIKIPLNLLKHDFVKTEQKANECQMHYFGGISRQQIGKMKFLSYNFNNNYVVNFYGGGKSLFCGIETEKIINSILNQ